MLLKELEIVDSSKKTLDRLKIKEATPIQETALPYLLAGNSSIITSQTGSGKTLCYLLPILNKLEYENNNVQAIIILPTKELARQVYSRLLDFKNDDKLLKPSLIIGNGNLDQQLISLRKNPAQIVVGTTTRIIDLLHKKIFNPHLIKTIVLDEVDMLMDLGFANQVADIMNYVDTPTLQKIACSATTHESLSNKLAKYFKNTKVISTSKSI
jgi:ATP-dependent RNA helicase CshB